MRVARVAAVWLLILCLAMLNGLLREAVLVPALGGRPALIASGVLLSVVILVVARVLIRFMAISGDRPAIGAGMLWLGLTLAFEFGFGRFAQHKTWDELLRAYTFEGGNTWPLVLIVVLLAPLVAFRLRSRSA